jgi:hypothetical protein
MGVIRPETDMLASDARKKSFARWFRGEEKSFYETVRQQDIKYGNEQGFVFFKANYQTSMKNSTIKYILDENRKYKTTNLRKIYKQIWGVADPSF